MNICRSLSLVSHVSLVVTLLYLLAKITGLLSFTVISDSREQCTFLIHMHWLSEYVYFLFLPKLKQTP